MREKLISVIESYKVGCHGEEYIEDTNGELLLKMTSILEAAGIKYNSCFQPFDGGPGYEAIHYVIAFIDENGNVDMIDWVEEDCWFR